MWSELDRTSNWANKDYEGDGETLPKRSVYDNTKAYNAARKTKELGDFYDRLISGMEESNSKISFLGNVQAYKMPQISGRLIALLKRNGNILKTLKYEALDSVKIKDDDLDYVEKFDTRPDGTAIKNVPTRFIKRLDKPANITTDLIGAMVSYHGMATNFEKMSGI